MDEQGLHDGEAGPLRGGCELLRPRDRARLERQGGLEEQRPSAHEARQARTGPQELRTRPEHRPVLRGRDRGQEAGRGGDPQEQNRGLLEGGAGVRIHSRPTGQQGGGVQGLWNPLRVSRGCDGVPQREGTDQPHRHDQGGLRQVRARLQRGPREHHGEARPRGTRTKAVRHHDQLSRPEDCEREEDTELHTIDRRTPVRDEDDRPPDGGPAEAGARTSERPEGRARADQEPRHRTILGETACHDPSDIPGSRVRKPSSGCQVHRQPRVRTVLALRGARAQERQAGARTRTRPRKTRGTTPRTSSSEEA